MITTSLIIAHLLSDFTLQPTKLIKWKVQSFKGIIFHVLIFGLVASILLFPYLLYWQTWVVILGILVIHYFTDKVKINIESKDKNAFPMPFIADQALHLASLVVGGYILEIQNFQLPTTWFFENIYKNIYVWLGFGLVIFIIYLIDILFFQESYLTSYNYTQKRERNRKKVIIKKLIVFTVVYAVFIGAALLLNY